MQPYQVAVGLSMATLGPLAYFTASHLSFVSGYWGWLFTQYGYQIGLLISTVFLATFFGFFQIARVLSLGDVGSRIEVLDKQLREGRGGDAELVDALHREETGNFQS